MKVSSSSVVNPSLPPKDLPQMSFPPPVVAGDDKVNLESSLSTKPDDLPESVSSQETAPGETTNNIRQSKSSRLLQICRSLHLRIAELERSNCLLQMKQLEMKNMLKEMKGKRMTRSLDDRTDSAGLLNGDFE